MTDPEAKLARKGRGKEAKLSFSAIVGAAYNLVRLSRLVPAG